MALSITSGTASAAATSDPELKVMSWNIAGGGCSSEVSPQEIANRIDTISKEHAVTVFGLQEIHRDQVERVTDQLAATTGVPYYYKFGSTNCGGKFGNAIISRYQIRDGFSFTYDRQAPDDNGELRGAVGGRIEREGLRVWIFTTHLTGKGGVDTGPDPVRAAQAIQMSDTADAVSSDPVRTIVTGDFNDRPSGTDVGIDDAYFAMHKHYSDTWQAYANAANIMALEGYTAPSSNPIKRIDYIWKKFNSFLYVNSSGVLQGTTSSDHLPVITDFAVLTAS